MMVKQMRPISNNVDFITPVTIVFDYKNEYFDALIDFFIRVKGNENPNHIYVDIDEAFIIESLLNPSKCPFPYSLAIKRFINYLDDNYNIKNVSGAEIVEDMFFIHGYIA